MDIFWALAFAGATDNSISTIHPHHLRHRQGALSVGWVEAWRRTHDCGGRNGKRAEAIVRVSFLQKGGR